MISAFVFGTSAALLTMGTSESAVSIELVETKATIVQASKVAFGRQLFQSRLLSADGTTSCRTCHVPALNFSGDKALSVGVAGFRDYRRAPSIVGLRTSTELMWDGSAATLSAQIPMPLESPEMAINWGVSLVRLRADPEIARLAALASIEVDKRAVLSSLVAYVASLTAGSSRFDRFYFDHDQTALSPEEALGLRIFIQKARCSSCNLVDGRSAPFTDGAFHNIGIGQGPNGWSDLGRSAITHDPKDAGAFKTPSLRGVALRPFLMHDGSVRSLRQAIEYYNHGVDPRVGADPRIRPLFLTSDEVNALVSFLTALNSESSIEP